MFVGEKIQVVIGLGDHFARTHNPVLQNSRPRIELLPQRPLTLALLFPVDALFVHVLKLNVKKKCSSNKNYT
jgi:hypothetical protein